MKKTLAILCILLLISVALPIEAANRANRTIILKKVPRQPKQIGTDRYKVPAVPIICYVEKDSGIQPLDTSEIESYEVWDCSGTAPIVIYEDISSFVEYILDDASTGIIKLFTPDYIYIGNLD